MPISANGQTYTDDQIKSFFAGNPDNNVMTSKAKELGMNADQLTQAMLIGRGQDANTMNPAILQSYYRDASNMMGTMPVSGQTGLGDATSFYSSGLGRSVAQPEIQQYLATNPSVQQIGNKASAMGFSPGDLGQALTSGGVGASSPEAQRALWDRIQASFNTGSDGFAQNASNRIVPIGAPGAMLSNPTHSGGTYSPANLGMQQGGVQQGGGQFGPNGNPVSGQAQYVPPPTAGLNGSNPSSFPQAGSPLDPSLFTNQGFSKNANSGDFNSLRGKVLAMMNQGMFGGIQRAPTQVTPFNPASIPAFNPAMNPVPNMFQAIQKATASPTTPQLTPEEQAQKAWAANFQQQFFNQGTGG